MPLADRAHEITAVNKLPSPSNYRGIQVMSATMAFRPVLTLSAVTLLASSLAHADGDAVPVLTAGSKWVVARTTSLTALTIPAGASVTAADGHSLTMTVDGIGTPIAAGSYQGDIVLTVTDDIPVKYKELDPHHFRVGLYVDDGKVIPEKSVKAAIVGGQVSDASATGVSITSNEEKFNGILVTGNSKYSIVNPTIRFTGNGGNDFAGYGAAIMSSGTAEVTVSHAKITNKGAVRTAVFVGGNSTMHVKNTTIDVANGTLPADYKFTIEVGKMMAVPWMLGLTGNIRATNLVDNGTAYYSDSHIRTQGWGALSTDDTKRVRMYVSNTTVEAVESGYGAYTIGDSVDRFSHSTLNVHDYGMIMAANGSGTFTNGTIVNSGRFGVMMHSGIGLNGTLLIEKGSIFNTKSTAIQVKGRGANIIVDDAQLNAGNGILLQAMINDDPMAPGGPGGPGAPGGPGGPPAPAGAVVGVQSPAPIANAADGNTVHATFRNVTLQGDIINSRPSQGDMLIRLEKASLTGGISTAIAEPSTGKTATADTYYLIGDVKNTFAASTEKNGLRLTLADGSTWTINQTSYLTKLTIAPGATLTAQPGFVATLKVNGATRPIAAGTYAGKIVVEVTKS